MKQERVPLKKRSKNLLLPVLLTTIILTVGGILLVRTLTPSSDPAPAEPSNSNTPSSTNPTDGVSYFYDNLTGEVLTSTKDSTPAEAQAKADEINSQRIFCMQMPNGLDGARPQVGLDQAKIVFEAIAEAGITRFAVIYRGLTDATIGPIRSLRNYYLDWDVPFDCTIVHAGGEEEALRRVAAYDHLTESTTYMWRTGGHWSGNNFIGYIAPNNLFTDGKLLNQFAASEKTTTSNPQVWPRLTPAESETQKTTSDSTSESATSINIDYGATGFNVHYDYDPKSNHYLRSYTNYGKHTYYICPEDLNQPAPQEQCGDLVQVTPSVVITMSVKEHLSEVNHYREVITTTGSGDALVFQNGHVIKGTWQKASVESQITFKDESGEVIKLAPGQTWISAVPDYKTVSYE